jgi:hypothetical protein
MHATGDSREGEIIMRKMGKSYHPSWTGKFTSFYRLSMETERYEDIIRTVEWFPSREEAEAAIPAFRKILEEDFPHGGGFKERRQTWVMAVVSRDSFLA